MFCLFTMLSLLPASMRKANCKVIHFSPHRHHSIKEKVGRWPPCHVLHEQKTNTDRTDKTDIMVYPKLLSKRMHPPSRTVASAPRPPTTKETVPSRRGNEYPRFLLEDGARRPPSYYSYGMKKPQLLHSNCGSKNILFTSIS